MYNSFSPFVDPKGAKMVHYYNHGELKAAGSSITEGIGQGRVTGNLVGFKPDYAFEIDDTVGMKAVYDVMKEEGLCLGTSSGINIAGSMELARKLGPGHTLVTILCDLGTRYTGKMFNLDFLTEKSLPTPAWVGQGLSDDVEHAMHATIVPDEVAKAEQEANAAKN